MAGESFLPPVVIDITMNNSAVLAKTAETKAALAEMSSSIGGSVGGMSSKVTTAERDLETRSSGFSATIAKAFTGIGSSMGNFGIPFGHAVSNMGTKIEEAEKKGSGFKESMLQIGKTATAISGVALVGVGTEAVKMALNYEKASSILQTAVRNSGGNFSQLKPKIDAAQSSMRALGFTDQETAEALAKLTVSTGSTSTATSKMGLVADLARTKHEGLAQAAETVAKVYAGSNRAMLQLGIQAGVGSGKLAALQTASHGVESAQIGLQKTTKEVEEGTIKGTAASEKMEAAHRTLSLAEQKLHQDQGAVAASLDKLEKKLHGTADAYGHTLSGQIDKAKASIDHIVVAFGQFLLPILTVAAGALAHTADFFSKGGLAAKALAAIIIGPLSLAVGYFVTTKLISMVQYVGTASKALMTLGARAIAAAAEFLPAVAEMTLALGGMVIEAVAAGIAIAIAWAPIILAIGAIGLAIYLLATHWTTVWNAIKTAVSAAVTFIKKHIVLLLAIIFLPAAALVEIAKHWKQIWGTIVKAVKDAAHAIGSSMSEAWRTIKSSVSTAWKSIAHVFESAWEHIKSAARGLISFFISLPGKIWNALSGLESKMLLFGKRLVQALVSGILSAPGAIVHAIAKLIPGGGILSSVAHKIGLMAEGGIVTKPTLAVVGEAGPEAVIPLSGLATAQSAVKPLEPAGRTAAAPVGSASGLKVESLTIHGADMSPNQLVQNLYLALRPMLQGA